MRRVSTEETDCNEPRAERWRRGKRTRPDKDSGWRMLDGYRDGDCQAVETETECPCMLRIRLSLAG